LVGVGLLVGGGFRGSNGNTTMSLVGTLVVLVSSFAWAAGSVYSNRQPISASTTMAASLQMLAGGFLLLLMGLITGDFTRLNISNISWVSIGAFSYLTIFGSLLVFTAYSWLLRNVAPTRVATYAYVNPVVAVFLGWLIASEPLTLRMMIAAAVIVVSVVLITTFGRETAKSFAKDDPHASDCPTYPCA
jgi:drug/metabolite transporter (DMT)-like permease